MLSFQFWHVNLGTVARITHTLYTFGPYIFLNLYQVFIDLLVHLIVVLLH